MKQQILDIIERHSGVYYWRGSALLKFKWDIVAEEISELIDKNGGLSVVERCKDAVGQTQAIWEQSQKSAEVVLSIKQAERIYSKGIAEGLVGMNNLTTYKLREFNDVLKEVLYEHGK